MLQFIVVNNYSTNQCQGRIHSVEQKLKTKMHLVNA